MRDKFEVEVTKFLNTMEEGIHEVMSWAFFYPYTMLRLLLTPRTFLRFVEKEAELQGNAAYGSSMRPMTFLFISLAIGSLFAPLDERVIKASGNSSLGDFLTSSWLNLLIARTVLFSVFPLTGALLYDLLTPGAVTRETLSKPFQQQAFIFAPFALVASPVLVRIHELPLWVIALSFVVIFAWVILVEIHFFRSFAQKSFAQSILLAIATLMVGIVLMGVVSVVVFRP